VHRVTLDMLHQLHEVCISRGGQAGARPTVLPLLGCNRCLQSQCSQWGHAVIRPAVELGALVEQHHQLVVPLQHTRPAHEETDMAYEACGVQ
jgi:hypothetical protein